MLLRMLAVKFSEVRFACGEIDHYIARHTHYFGTPMRNTSFVGRISTDMLCPACHGPLHPTELACPACDIKVQGDFANSEFAVLSSDELHFLRIFIHCEGRIRDMESALGISYPTVKSRLASLKEKLESGREQTRLGSEREAQSGSLEDVTQILDEFERGDLTYDEILSRITGTPGKEGTAADES